MAAKNSTTTAQTHTSIGTLRMRQNGRASKRNLAVTCPKKASCQDRLKKAAQTTTENDSKDSVTKESLHGSANCRSDSTSFAVTTKQKNCGSDREAGQGGSLYHCLDDGCDDDFGNQHEQLLGNCRLNAKAGTHDQTITKSVTCPVEQFVCMHRVTFPLQFSRVVHELQ